jgi:hypothetical protein
MSGFFASGHVVDAVLGFLALEVLALVLWRGARPVPALSAALPGALLLLALRAALTGADWQWVALWIALSLPAHLMDLQLRRP